MRPPICDICDKDLTADEGGLVYFKRRPSDIEWEKRMKEGKMVGHPPYAAWFCGEHHEQARELSHLPINEAMRIIKQNL
jgi:hypothetical protein